MRCFLDPPFFGTGFGGFTMSLDGGFDDVEEFFLDTERNRSTFASLASNSVVQHLFSKFVGD